MSVSATDLAIDRQLSEIGGALPMLRLLTPTNVPETRRAFLGGEAEEPVFTYLPVPDLDRIEAELTAINPEAAVDPILIHLSRGMHRELQRRLELLRNRNTDRFLLTAIETFGTVDQPLLDLALEILARTPPGPPSPDCLTAIQVAKRANAELDHYRARFPELTSRVHINVTAPGVMVENGDLFIGADTTIAATRVEQLIQHEIGVHVLTHANGTAQPIRMLALGLAGYEETQEALGVLAEHLSGGLGPGRLRVLALRVLAARAVSDRIGFGETFQLLREHGAGRYLAFMTTMRAHRSGGMTKDALYLSGLTRLLDHLGEGGRLNSLLVGKISLPDEPLVADLLDRGVLVEPPLTPRFLASPSAIERLDLIRGGMSVIELGGIAA